MWFSNSTSGSAPSWMQGLKAILVYPHSQQHCSQLKCRRNQTPPTDEWYVKCGICRYIYLASLKVFRLFKRFLSQEGNYDKCYNTYELQNIKLSEISQSTKTTNSVRSHLYEIPRAVKRIETGSRTAVGRSRREVGMRGYCVTRTELQLCRMRRALQMGSGDGWVQ